MSQIGFDFDDVSTPAFRESAPRTWERPDLSDAAIASFYKTAAVNVELIVGAARPLFNMGIKRGIEVGSESPYIHGVTFDQARAFLKHCEQMAGSSFPSIEYKLRYALRATYAGIFVEGVGSLVVILREGGGIDAHYCQYRSTFFLDSYQDTMTAFDLPYDKWGNCYCADKIAYAGHGKGIAAVPTFAHNGRRYICTSTAPYKQGRQCQAWTACLAADWKGPTYNYSTLHKAVDEGRIERGDYRGLIVSVRGQLCVVESAAVFYADRADDNVILLRADDEHDPQDEVIEDDTSDEDELLAA